MSSLILYNLAPLHVFVPTNSERFLYAWAITVFNSESAISENHSFFDHNTFLFIMCFIVIFLI